MKISVVNASKKRVEALKTVSAIIAETVIEAHSELEPETFIKFRDKGTQMLKSLAAIAEAYELELQRIDTIAEELSDDSDGLEKALEEPSLVEKAMEEPEKAKPKANKTKPKVKQETTSLTEGLDDSAKDMLDEILEGLSL
jgi:cysteine sulfinate desulfinase/cysteine desulfurase-like protein